MSVVYNLEPQPTAKVILHTTSGDILLELFAQQTPLTSRNFLQLCLDGYYDNNVFYRLVPGFIIQGGDPTGTGSGGGSSFKNGAPFADEIHSRLKFNRRGLLGMANTGVRDDNGSQFFLTLGKTEELTGRNTMFGRVEGDTIFNLVKMGEADMVEGKDSDRPMYPTRITGTEVLVNPFEDMVKRATIATRTVEDRQPKKKVKKLNGKAVLSFVGNDGDEEEAAPVRTVKFNPKLISAGQTNMNRTKQNIPMEIRQSKEIQERPPKRQLSRSPSPPRPAPTRVSTTKPTPPSRSSSPASSVQPLEITNHNTLLSRTNAQIAELKSSLKRKAYPTLEPARKKSTLEAMIPPTSTRGRKRTPGGSGKDDQVALAAFNAFRKKLDDAPLVAASPSRTGDPAIDSHHGALPPAAAAPGNGDAMDAEASLCDLHFIADCQSCSRWDREEDDSAGGGAKVNGEEDNDGWMSRQLTFAKDRLGKDLEWKRQNEQFVVIDPREREKGFKEERRRKREVK